MKPNAKNTVFFLLTGAAAGAAVALLYAPKTGVQTRKEVRRFTKKTVDRLDDMQENLREQVGIWVEDVNDLLRDGVRNGKKFSTQTYEQVLGALDAAKKVVEDGKNRVQSILA